MSEANLSQSEIDRLAVKQAASMFSRTLETIAARTARSREIACAKTKIEEAEMWALKHLAAPHV